jgi:hypothetical protein
MGSLIFGSYRGLNKELQEKAIEIIEEKRKEIIEFFHTKGSFEKPNGNINDASLNKDKAIEKIYYPEENRYNLHLKIYNLPGIFRNNDGLFEIIGKTLMIFQTFFNKYNDIDDKEKYQKIFDEFFDSLTQANNKKIKEIIGLDIKDNDLKKMKQGLESLMDIFGEENIKSYYRDVYIYCGGAAAIITIGSLLSFLLIPTLSVSMFATPFSLFIITGFAGYLIHKHIKKNHSQNVKNNVHKIQDFYDKIQSFLSEGADYFCKDGEKNLFVIAYEKDRNNSVKEICLFPYYLNGLRDSVCPTLGNNALPGSNTEYYRTLLDACKYYIDNYSQRIYEHINIRPQPGLQEEMIDEFEFLRSATIQEIQAKIHSGDEIEKFKILNNHQYIENGMEYQKIDESLTNNNSGNVSIDFNQINQDYYNQQYDSQQENNQIYLNEEFN